MLYSGLVMSQVSQGRWRKGTGPLAQELVRSFLGMIRHPKKHSGEQLTSVV